MANYLIRGEFADYGYFAFAREVLRAGDTHVDLGANFGFHTFGLLRFPDAATRRYVLVEANPGCAECISKSIVLHPQHRFVLFNVAATSTSGKFHLSFDPSATGSGLLTPERQSGSVLVSGVALDDLFLENGIEEIALLKIDIEGSEPAALTGLSRMLSNRKIRYIYFEVNPTCLAQQGSSADGLFDVLSVHGYRLFWPHASGDWIRRTCGRPELDEAALCASILPGSSQHRVVQFDRSLHDPDTFGQCDLVAVSPEI